MLPGELTISVNNKLQSTAAQWFTEINAHITGEGMWEIQTLQDS